MKNENMVSISKRNNKMGEIPSVSLPPMITCPGCKHCLMNGQKVCYAVKMCELRPTVKAAYERNLAILKKDRDSYFLQVKAAAMITRFFRWHVSGDIMDADYLDRMVKMARELKNTEFLCFTKSYEIVNKYFESHRKPNNFHLIMSLPFNGARIENPHNFPTAVVVFKGMQVDPNWKTCGNDCSNCACRGLGCWKLKKGETVAFKKH